jgi:hypothetical protein
MAGPCGRLMPAGLAVCGDSQAAARPCRVKAHELPKNQHMRRRVAGTASNVPRAAFGVSTMRTPGDAAYFHNTILT